jgi:hypothetical protein
VDDQPANLRDRADGGIHVGDQDFPANPGESHVLPKGGAKDDIRVRGPDKRKDVSLQDIQ